MNVTFFQFHSKGFFWLAALLPVVFFYELRKLRLIKLSVPSLKIVQGGRRTWRSRLEFLPALLKTLSMALLIVALARPQVVNQDSRVKSEGVDIILTLDTSGSMKALDMQLRGERTDRMNAVKSVVGDFISGRQYDRIGMVIFGENAYTQCPLTLDYDILRGYLDLIDIGIAGDATAIGNALATSVKRLEGSTAESRVVVLLTDGANTAGEVSPQAAAEVAARRGIKVYAIAFGSREKLVPFPVETPFGTRVQNVQLEVDEDVLKMIADKTGGKFFRADSTATLGKIYDTIDELEKTEVEVEKFTDYEEKYWDWLAAAVALLLIGWVLRHTYFLRVP
jgi:Ca-activated chloride channel family protein